MADLGDMITRDEIRRTPCPRHGRFCNAVGPPSWCRARIDKAIAIKHADRVAENKRRRSPCLDCRSGRWHVHLG